jgi:LemA protein
MPVIRGGVVIVVVVCALLLVWLVSVFNRLIRYRNQYRNAWSSVDVNLKKRHDLIPNLVETVRGYMKHESSVLEQLTQLRARAGAGKAESEEMEAEAELGSHIAVVMARAEAYPDLKASENFLQLQATLTEIEEQISAARRAYNAAVMDYNNTVEQFPSNVIAAGAGFQTASFFSADPVCRQIPQVGIA